MRVVLPLALLVAARSGTVRGQDVYEPCPRLPDPSWADEATIMADSRWVEAVERVDQLLENATRTHALPGLVATVTVGRRRAWFKGYGKRDAREAASPPPAEDDLVWIASITKTFTALLLFQLRDEGLVSLDSAVADLFPGGAFGYRSPYPTDRPMTLRQLASHTSGLPRETPFVCVHCNETEAMILAAVKQQWLVNDPGTRFHYSNLGFAVLGRALGHAAGQSYEALIQSRCLQPLNMTTATFTTPADLSGVAVGLTSEGSAGILRHGDGWGAPCGDLLASSADMAKWLMLFARRRGPRRTAEDRYYPMRNIIDGSTVTEMLQPVVMLRDGSSAVGSPFEFKCALPVTPTHPTPHAHTKVLL